MGVFNGWFGTRWYGMLYQHRDEQDAAAMALPLITKGKLSPGMELLDMACGRGRHAGIFAKAGLRVTGIDLSSESLKEAALMVPEAYFEVFDIRAPFATGRFDAAVCLFTSLGYSADRRDDQQAVAAAVTALKPGGLFVLDLMNGERISQSLIPQETQTVEGVTFTLKRSTERGCIVKRITVEHSGQREEFEERVHAWSLKEVKAMVANAGFILEDITDGSCKLPFNTQTSDRMVIWARKPA